MDPQQLALAVSVLAVSMSCGKTADEIAQMAAIIVQLGDTLATISTRMSALEK